MSQLTITVPGTAKPKGSLRHVGHGRLIEQVKGSKAWREAVVVAAAQARDLAGWECLTGSVLVDVQVSVPRPKTVRRDEPTTRSSGDVDKHARNILDALVDAGIVGDDSQVTELRITKEYATADPSTGPSTVIRVSSTGPSPKSVRKVRAVSAQASSVSTSNVRSADMERPTEAERLALIRSIAGHSEGRETQALAEIAAVLSGATLAELVAARVAS